MTKRATERATELEWLKWFACEADFGPSDGGIKLMLQDAFEDSTGKLVPSGWRRRDEKDFDDS